MPDYQAGSASIRIGIDMRGFDRDLRSELEARDVELGVGIKPDLASIADLQSKLDAISRSEDLHVNVKVRAETRDATTDMERWRAEQSGQRVRQTVEVDRDQARRSAKEASGDIKKALGELREAGTLNLGVLALDGAPGVVAALLSVADGAAKATHALALLPAAAAGAAATFGALKIGLHGVSDVLKEMSTIAADPIAAAREQADAVHSLEDAEYRQAEAQRSVQTASREMALDQKELTDAYREVSRSIRDTNNQLDEQKLSAEGAALSVQDAAKHLNEVNHDPTADANTRRRAQLEYQESILHLTDQQNKTKDLAEDTARANAKGVEGSDKVIAAKQKIADQANAEVAAQHELTDATYELAKAQKTAAAGGSEMQKLAEKIAQLSPNAQNFITTVKGLQPAWKDMRTTAQDALFNHLGDSIKTLADAQLPNLKTGLTGINSALNTGLRATLIELSSKTNQLDFRQFLSNTTVGLENLAKGAAPLTDGITKLVTVGSEFFPQFGSELASAAQRFDNLIQRTSADGSLKEWIQRGLDSAHELIQTIEHISSSIASVARAASASGTGLKGLEEATGRIADFLKTPFEQGKLESFFSGARAETERWKPIIADLPGLISSVAEAVRTWSSVTMPFLKTAVDLLSAHPGLVQDAVIAYLGFKTVGPIFSAVRGQIADTNSTLNTMRAAARNVNDGINSLGTGVVQNFTGPSGIATVAGYGRVQLGQFGTAVQQLGTHVPVIANMQGSFLNAATSAERFGRTAGTFSAIGTGLSSAATGIKNASTGIVSALGGGWVIAITAAVAAVAEISDEFSKADEHAKAMKRTMQEIGVARSELTETFSANGGAFDASAISNVTGQIEIMKKSLSEAANNRAGFFENGLSSITFSDSATNKNWYADRWKGAKQVIDDLKLSDKQLAETLGDTSKFNELTTKLNGMGQDGRFAVSEMTSLRDEIVKARDIARDTTPGFSNLTAAVKTLSDTSATGADRVSALKNALDILSGKSVSAQDALARYNDQVRQTSELTSQWDASQGTGQQLVNGDKIDTTTANGRKLYDVLKQIRDATADAAIAGNDLDPILAKNDKQFQDLAQATGLDAQTIKELATGIGYLPNDIKILAKLQGADDVKQQLTVINEELEKHKDGITIPTKALTDDTRHQLEQLGIKIEQITGKPDEVRVVAKTDDALAKLQEVINKQLPDKTQKINIDWKLADNASPVARLLHQTLVDQGVVQPSVPTRAAGGRLPTSGPGTETRDGILAVTGAGMPIARVDGGEWVINRDSSARYHNELSQINAGTYPKVGGYEDGGQLPNADGTQQNQQTTTTATARSQQIEDLARSLAGQPYGGALDCSGLMSELANVAAGLPANTGRMSTANEGEWLKALGFQSGTGGLGSFSIGWINDPSMGGGGHTAGTLPSGINIESSGSAGKVLYGGSALGANAGMFINHAYLTMGQGVGNAANPGSTANASTTTPQTVVNPQAALPGAKSDSQITIETDKAAVDTANSERNAVYANPASTAQDKHAADLKYQQAQNTLQSAMKKSGSADISVQGIASRAAGILATGVLSFFGLENSILSSSNTWNQSLSSLVTGLNEYGGGSTTGYTYVPQNLPTIVTTSTQQGDGTTTTIPASGPVTTTPGTYTAPTTGTDTYAAQFGADPSVVDSVKGAAALYGWGSGAEWDAEDQLIGHESSWRPTASAEPASDAYGLFQFLSSTWSTVGGAKTSDPKAQAIYGNKYIQQRYGDPVSAWSFWQQQSPHWYDDGGAADGVGLLAKNVIAPERVLSPHQTETYDSMLPLMERINAQSGWARSYSIDPVTGGRAAPAAASNRDHSINFHGDTYVMNNDQLVTDLDRWNSMQAQGVLAAHT